MTTALPSLSEFDWLEFALAVLLIELTPGPNMAWLATLSLTEGRVAGLLATLGVALGLAANAMLAALGLAALVAAEPPIEAALRWAGVALMLWLAYGAWRETDPVADRAVPRHPGRAFAAGLFVNLLNPKALVFFIAVVPPFLNGQQATLPQAAALAGVSVGIATVVHCAIVLGAASAHRWMLLPERERRVRRVMALMLVGVALWLALGKLA